MRAQRASASWRSGRELNPRIRVLQTLALPLGYRTTSGPLYLRMTSHSTPIRPHVFGTILFMSILLLSACTGGTEVTESDRIRVMEPKMGAEIRSPFVLRGEARVFEGTVRYRIID